MTTTTETNQAADDGDLFSAIRRLFEEAPEPEEYEFVPVPGLHLAEELEDVIRPGAPYVVWQRGELHDGRMLLTVFRAQAKVTASVPTGVPSSGSMPTPKATEAPAAAPPQAGVPKRGR